MVCSVYPRTGGLEETMEKEIRIRLKSERYEVDASLFSSAEEDTDGLFCLDEDDLQKPEVMEIQSVGTMRISDGRVEIVYDETEATGMAGSRTVISFLEGEAGIVSMVREGTVSTSLVFESAKRYRCVYQTPYMPFEICVHTRKVENRLLADGILNLDYVIEIRGAKAERTKFFMQIL